MPNWCSTSLLVRGPQEQVKNFRNGIKVVDAIPPQTAGELKILEGYIPCPDELLITISTMAYEQVPEEWQKQVDDGHWTQEWYDKKVEENALTWKQQQSNLEKYGAKDWYDWQYKNWGVKWGDCDAEIISMIPSLDNSFWILSISFQTPWGTADAGWQTISEMFPDCLFDFSHDEEAGFFEGVEMIQDGQVKFSSMYEPCSYEDEVDWDNDDSINKFEDWKETNRLSIHSEVDNFLIDTGWIKITPPAPVEKTTPKPHSWK